jgi:hypothetical protein
MHVLAGYPTTDVSEIVYSAGRTIRRTRRTVKWRNCRLAVSLAGRHELTEGGAISCSTHSLRREGVRSFGGAADSRDRRPSSWPGTIGRDRDLEFPRRVGVARSRGARENVACGSVASSWESPCSRHRQNSGAHFPDASRDARAGRGKAAERDYMAILCWLR